MGFDDRVKKALDNAEKKPQLIGHTKTYCKVVLPQLKDVIGEDQPAEALIGKCVKVKVTEAGKWHISGYIIDWAPKPEKVPADYFENLEQKRKNALI
jgi:tRNA A37 methylthiotransferase MiaB